MRKLSTEKSIREAIASGQRHFGDTSIRALLEVIDEQRGLIAMHEANADEAALKAEGREAKINEMYSTLYGVKDWGERFEIEFKNLRAQVAEARLYGSTVNMFEELAWQLTTAHKADVVANVEWTETE